MVIRPEKVVTRPRADTPRIIGRWGIMDSNAVGGEDEATAEEVAPEVEEEEEPEDTDALIAFLAQIPHLCAT